VYGPPSNSRGHPRGAGAGGGGTGRDEGPTRAILAVLVLLGLLLFALIPPVRALRRRARLRRAAPHPRRSILVAYDVFTERAAGLGLARHAGETPQEYRRRLAISGARTDGDLDALTRLTVRAAYAAPEPGTIEADEARRAAVRAIRDLRRGTAISRRVVGAWFPER
jgi:hypothetical protein